MLQIAEDPRSSNDLYLYGHFYPRESAGDNLQRVSTCCRQMILSGVCLIFSFVAGKPYDQATFDAGLPVAVITESVARRLFQTTEAVGREFLLNHAPYTVSGVVKDVSTLANTAYAQVWVPYTSTEITKSTLE